MKTDVDICIDNEVKQVQHFESKIAGAEYSAAVLVGHGRYRALQDIAKYKDLADFHRKELEYWLREKAQYESFSKF